MNTKKNAMSLVEILIAMAIMVIILVPVYNVLRGGIDLYKQGAAKIEDELSTEGQAKIFLDKLVRLLAMAEPVSNTILLWNDGYAMGGSSYGNPEISFTADLDNNGVPDNVVYDIFLKNGPVISPAWNSSDYWAYPEADVQNVLAAGTVEITNICYLTVEQYDPASDTWEIPAAQGIVVLWHYFNKTRLRLTIYYIDQQGMQRSISREVYCRNVK